MTELTKAQILGFQAEVNVLVNELAIKHGLVGTTSKLRWREGEYMRMEVSLANVTRGAGGVPVICDKQRSDWNSRANRKFGLPTEWLDQSFGWEGDMFRITGLNARSSVYPVRCTRDRDQATSYFAPITVRTAMAVQDAYKKVMADKAAAAPQPSRPRPQRQVQV